MNFNFLSLFTISLFFCLSSCAINENLVLTYEQSNASQIKKSIESFDFINKIESVVDTNDKVVIVSIESSGTYDDGITAQIEDVLVSELVTNSFIVLERDNDMINKLISESDSSYTLFNRYQSYENDVEYSAGVSRFSGVSMEEGQVNSSIGGGSNSYSSSEKYKRENFGQLYESNLHTADKIISYRVVECGVQYESSQDDDWNEIVLRVARTILEVRIYNAKTGQILLTTTLDGDVNDELSVEDYKVLERFAYRNYHSTYPKKYRNPSVQVIDQPEVNSRLVLPFVGLGVLTMVILLAI